MSISKKSETQNRPEQITAIDIDNDVSRLFGFPASVAPYAKPWLEDASALYGLGFNVFPMPFPRKNGYPWRRLQFVRLHGDDLPSVFDYRCNVAIMAGRTSGNLFILDCEDASSFTAQGAELRKRSIPLFAVRSGGAGGGGHYYLRCADGEVKNIPPSKARALGLGNLEIRGNRCYVLTPPSVHPVTGQWYEWAARETDSPPIVRLSDLDWLPLELSTSANTSRRPRKSYGQAALEGEIAKLANTPNGSHDRNNQLNRSAFALGQLVASSALSYIEVEIALTRTAYNIGLTSAEIPATIASGLNAGMQEPRLAPPTTYGNEYRKAIAWISAQQWHGRTATTRRAVAVALAERAQYASNGKFRASVREIAGLARTSTNTTQRRLDELTASGFVERAGSDHVSNASLWSLGSAVREIDTLTNLESNSVSNSNVFTDAAERGALGKNGYLVYRELLTISDPIGVTALGKRLGLTRNQTNYALKTLQEKSPVEMPLVEKLPSGWVANPMADEWLDQLVAARHGTLGKGEARRAGFERERQAQAAKAFITAIHAEKKRVGLV